MGLAENLLRDSFGRPKGLLGKIGGFILARTNRKCAAWVVDILDVKPDNRVLEIGFGPGVGLELLARQAPMAKVFGVDVSEEMFRQATARNRAAIARGQMELRLGPAENLPFSDQRFDKALSINSLHIWSDPNAGLREVWRVTKPGGRIAFAFTPQSGQGKEGLLPRLAEAGFSDIQIVDGAGCFCVLAKKEAAL